MVEQLNILQQAYNECRRQGIIKVVSVRPETQWAIRIQVYDWTDACCKTLRGNLNRSERLIKLGDIWFSAKYI